MEDFRRDFTYRAKLQDDGIHLTAEMKDTFHDLRLEIRVDAGTLTITSATAAFTASPTEFCSDVTSKVSKLAGMVIGKGMNRRLLELFGGGNGCGNIRTILSGLLPLALNIQAAKGVRDENELMETIRNKLEGTCAGYPRRHKEN